MSNQKKTNNKTIVKIHLVVIPSPEHNATTIVREIMLQLVREIMLLVREIMIQLVREKMLQLVREIRPIYN